MRKNNVFIWSIVVALGGFLFGFDTAVISGAEQSIQKYWQLNDYQHGFTVSIALIGTFFGALIGGIPSNALGRKKTLLLIAAIYLLASLGTALATNWYVFLLFRFLGGLGVGASSVTAPIYISEISPSNRRGRLVALFQFNIVFGILVSYLSNYLIGRSGEDSWRLMLGIQAIPSFLFLILIRFVPESPRWLILNKGRIDEAGETMKIIDPDGYEKDLEEIKNSMHLGNSTTESVFSKTYRKPAMLAFLFALFNQLSGINAIIYFAPRIFEMSGLAKSSSLLSTVGIGLVNFSFTLLAMNFIDRFGRKMLMQVGSVGLIATLGIASLAMYSHLTGWAVTGAFLVYIAFFAFSQGAVIWVFISEIFPNEVRAQGQTLGSSTHWAMAIIIAFSFPFFSHRFGGAPIFAFFCAMMILQLIFVWKVMPETKGRSLEQIGQTVIMH
ncbi:MAG: MFS transporter [Bacteroidetes bacterium]|nr:MAG: MFS transporter [Bacteroidota bacterium]